MLQQIFTGSILITASTLLSAVFIAIAMFMLRKTERWLAGDYRYIKFIFVLSGAALWMIAAFSASIWMWAIFLYVQDLFGTLEESLYFSMVSFTTLGFGDITLQLKDRLLSGFIAANGFVVFGLLTAFLLEVINLMRIDKS